MWQNCYIIWHAETYLSFPFFLFLSFFFSFFRRHDPVLHTWSGRLLGKVTEFSPTHFLTKPLYKFSFTRL